MPNMSYCRFENTASDLRDCEEHLLDKLDSEHEIPARRALVDTCIRIVEQLGLVVEVDADPDGSVDDQITEELEKIEKSGKTEDGEDEDEDGPEGDPNEPIEDEPKEEAPCPGIALEGPTAPKTANYAGIWIKDVCPICGKEYCHREGTPKPRTCGSMDCRREMIKQVRLDEGKKD